TVSSTAGASRASTAGAVDEASHSPRRAVALAAPAGGARSGGDHWVALVTAETENQLIAVDLPGGHVIKRLHLPADPENVDGRPDVRTAVVVSTAGRAVSLVDTRHLRVVRILHGFTKPHIAAI